MNDLLQVARLAARDAVAVHREHLGRVAVEQWSEKGTADFVSHVDRAAEAVIVERLRRAFPDHRVLAEEAASERAGASGLTNGGAGWMWIIDPLDGTTNYLHGYPAYAVSIGAAHGGRMQVAVVIHGATGEEWTAVRGGGAFLNGTRINVSTIDTLAHALIGTGFPFKALHVLSDYSRQLEAALRSTAGVRRAGSAALDLCHVATGYFDGFWELSLAPWDVAAGSLMVTEAGGVITRLDGDREVVGDGSILAGNAAIHAALGSLLRAATGAGRLHVG
ncbi:MAG TPA: inositol monophosphatase family protein [Longimicrobiales bacterium]